MAKIIACVNEKGGVAKTTTVKNLSVGLAMEGKRVLAIDLDPSANLTKSLGLEVDSEKGTISEILNAAKDFDNLPDGFGIMHQEEGIDVIVSSNDLHDCENELNSAFQKEVVLRRYLATIQDRYDYIFLDCPAGLGIFVVNALFCADSLIIPLEPQFLASEAMQNLFERISLVRKCRGGKAKPEVQGVLFTKVRLNTNNDRQLMDMHRERFSNSKLRVFKNFIPSLVKFSESDYAGESIYKYAPSSSAAMIYTDLVSEFLQSEQNLRTTD